MTNAQIKTANRTQLDQASSVIEQVYKWSSLIAGIASVALLAINAARPVESESSEPPKA